ncbi:hypothetical protein ACUNDV_23780 [Serratia sp. IR-2025]
MKEELYDLADHIARSKGALPPVWQDWASEIEMAVRKMANREAQPVGYFVRHRSAWDRPSKWRLWTECSAEDYAEFCKIIATGDADAGRFYEARILYDAPPAPAYPERLQCPVHLLPGLKFGKGIPTRSMLDALVRRAEYESEREAMTPEQKAEDDARIEAFKALLPQPPAPAVPDEATAENVEALSGYVSTYKMTESERDIAAEVWNACRAAMLAAAPEGGNG